jgi:hypothetical protein
MTEEKINAFRQTDTNLRDALKMDEAERPQMPADLNERLMQHMATRAKKPRRIVIWPWIAAACVAGVMMIWLTPPKEEITDVVVAENTPKVELPVADEAEPAKVEEAPKEIKAVKAVKRIAVKSEKPLLAQETKTEEPVNASVVNEPNTALAAAEVAKPQEKMVMMTERDIPITRPENYKYTPEELALMKKQANEAYLKWVELEMEIAKNNLEQTAQK